MQNCTMLGFWARSLWGGGWDVYRCHVNFESEFLTEGDNGHRQLQDTGTQCRENDLLVAAWQDHQAVASL